jgi:hypothetical protein
MTTAIRGPEGINKGRNVVFGLPPNAHECHNTSVS